MDESGNSPSTSLTLLQAARQRDPAALERLADLYGRYVWNRCRLRGLSPEEAEDVTQDVLIRMLNGLDRFDRQRTGSFRKWATTITRNRIIDRRRQHVPTAGGSEHLQRMEQVIDSSDDDECDLEPAMTWLVSDALDRIRPRFNERTWRAFWLVTIDGWSAPEVSQELGITAGRVRNCKRQVLTRLTEELEADATWSLSPE